MSYNETGICKNQQFSRAAHALMLGMAVDMCQNPVIGGDKDFPDNIDHQAFGRRHGLLEYIAGRLGENPAGRFTGRRTAHTVSYQAIAGGGVDPIGVLIFGPDQTYVGFTAEFYYVHNKLRYVSAP